MTERAAHPRNTAMRALVTAAVAVLVILSVVSPAACTGVRGLASRRAHARALKGVEVEGGKEGQKTVPVSFSGGVGEQLDLEAMCKVLRKMHEDSGEDGVHDAGSGQLHAFLPCERVEDGKLLLSHFSRTSAARLMSTCRGEEGKLACTTVLKHVKASARSETRLKPSSVVQLIAQGLVYVHRMVSIGQQPQFRAGSCASRPAQRA